MCRSYSLGQNGIIEFSSQDNISAQFLDNYTKPLGAWKLDEQIRQSLKMESLGKLAFGVAHDFNNLLTVIACHTDLAMMKLNPKDPVYFDLNEIQKTSERASALIQQLLAFSRNQVLEVKVFNLTALIDNLQNFLRRLIGEDIELVISQSPDLCNIKAVPCQIEQVIINLTANARDSMPDGGKLTIKTRSVRLDDVFCQNSPGLIACEYVLLEVSDTGCGISQDLIPKIFEPFFTTKPTDKGTGLGLSIIVDILKQSEGYISVDSEPRRGSCFKVYLPCVQDIATLLMSSASVMINHMQCTDTILVVEDELNVRNTVG